MDEQTGFTPMQEDPQKGEGLCFTITGEDTAAQDALNAQPPKKRSSPLPWILGGAAAVVAVALILILALRPGSKTPAAEPGETTIEETTAPEDSALNPQTPAEEDGQSTEEGGQSAEEAPAQAGNGVSYTVSADELTDEVLDREIAVCGDDRLTNRELPYYYWQQYYSLMNTYGSYAAYFIDSATPFDQQMCVFEESLTWQQYFLQTAITNYENVSAVWQDARLQGFQLSQEDQDYLDNLGSQITVSAAAYGFDSADAYLQTAYGPAAALTSYRAFVERQLIASAYLQSLVEAKSYTEADISAYFDANADSYASQGIEKSDVNMVNVRHILIQPAETNDDGSYTDEAWAAAEAQAQTLLDEWKNGEHTEDSFAFLAAENSADPGSATNGGLYEDVYPGQMVDEFDAWCFDAARKPGDTGIVKTSYGYHIMYFCSTGAHPYWYSLAEGDYLNQLSVDVLKELSGKFSVSDTEQNAALVDIMQDTQG